MDNEKTGTPGRLERVARGLLGAALMAGVIFSMTENGGIAGWSLSSLGI